MSKNLVDLPYTELVERAAQLARIERPSNAMSRVRAAVNDQYVREIPAKEDWTFLMVNSAITTVAEYKVGTISVNTQQTAVTFSSDAVLDATFTGRRIKFSDNANVYDFTFSNATGGTINPPLSGTRNISNGAYSIVQPIYALAADFDRFPKNGGLMLFQGGRITPLPERPIQRYFDEFTPFPGVPQMCRLTVAATDGTPQVELIPPPIDPLVIPYTYLQRLSPMRETTAGFISVNSSATAVVGSGGTTRFTEASTGWYFRVDAFGTGEDSEWYRVSAISTNSAATLALAFGLTGAVSAGYTMCPIPRFPIVLQPAIVYGAAQSLMADQNDPQFAVMGSLKTAALIQARTLYKSRDYRTQVETIFEEFLYRR